MIEDLRAAGLSTPHQIATGLNERGITAARGGAWSAVQVRRVLKSSTVRKRSPSAWHKRTRRRLLRN